ncbi:anthranilate phosphoribosyltransferase [Halobacterium sp. BOL4-2]|uniref:anthranilate phosphoribosyltransferase n=2 Tax=Halobacterium TaxID=2239 RepID=UPI0019636B62|nr:anthranilate phosphoribosyltransferase [Halobacterium sp. BOL4-2]QRY24047.1 anthranilate phosphoribosyltransferase [Halobacterium sp. BOL4-2]
MQEYIERVAAGEDLSLDAARDAVTTLFEDATDAEIGALLGALRAKGETEAEIAGFAQGMRDAAITVAPDCTPLVDTCGTGGDDYDTINVSTTAALVAAGAGIPTAKHGNYSVSSASGSSDVLDALGVGLATDPAAVEARIETDGIGYMHAPAFHPGMEAVIGPRRDLGVRTIFNLLGPLTNPARADAQVVGVYDPALVPVLARALSRMAVDRALVVHGAGLDEFALHGDSTVAEVDGDTVTTTTVSPSTFGLAEAPIDAVAGGGPEANAADLRGIVTGELTGPKRDIVVANAGAAIYVGGGADSLAAGADRAAAAIDSGAAADTLAALTDAHPVQQ